MYSYIPQDKQVIVVTVPPEDEATTPTLFLAGKQPHSRFHPTLVDTPGRRPHRQPALKLVPKTRQRDYDG